MEHAAYTTNGRGSSFVPAGEAVMTHEGAIVFRIQRRVAVHTRCKVDSVPVPVRCRVQTAV